jgi:hypothetical protein
MQHDSGCAAQQKQMELPLGLPAQGPPAVAVPDPTERLLTIPQVREIIQRIATEREIPELLALIPHMYRRQVRRKRKAKAPPVTPEMRAKIREYARAHPEARLQDIGDAVGLNQGRVSETLSGRR